MGATIYNGGAGGVFGGDTAGNGSFGIGGNSSSVNDLSGGGGGGYYGGGGGNSWGSGGAGSSYSNGSNIVYTGAFKSGDGLVTINYTPQQYNYLWSNGQTTATATGLSAGTYTVTVTDASGCTKSESVTITASPGTLAAVPTGTNVSCKGSNTGTVSVAASGGNPPYFYIWNTGATSNTISNLYTGVYTATVTDNSGCTISVSYNVIQPSIMLTVSIAKTNVRCGGKSTGSAIAAISGGAVPYTFLWNTGSTISSITNLPAATYTVTVTDANGCSKTKSVSITQNSALTAFAFPTVNAEASVNPGGGVPGYSYVWNTIPQQTTQTATGLHMNVVYKVKVTDSKGCTVTSTVSLYPCLNCREISSDNELDISVKPNPTNGLVMLKTSGSDLDHINVRIYNAVGKTLYNEIYKPNQMQFDLSKYSKGLYLFEVKTEKAVKTIRVVVEQK